RGAESWVAGKDDLSAGAGSWVSASTGAAERYGSERRRPESAGADRHQWQKRWTSQRRSRRRKRRWRAGGGGNRAHSEGIRGGDVAFCRRRFAAKSTD